MLIDQGQEVPYCTPGQMHMLQSAAASATLPTSYWARSREQLLIAQSVCRKSSKCANNVEEEQRNLIANNAFVMCSVVAQVCERCRQVPRVDNLNAGCLHDVLGDGVVEQQDRVCPPVRVAPVEVRAQRERVGGDLQGSDQGGRAAASNQIKCKCKMPMHAKQILQALHMQMHANATLHTRHIHDCALHELTARCRSSVPAWHAPVTSRQSMFDGRLRTQ